MSDPTDAEADTQGNTVELALYVPTDEPSRRRRAAAPAPTNPVEEWEAGKRRLELIFQELAECSIAARLSGVPEVERRRDVGAHLRAVAEQHRSWPDPVLVYRLRSAA